MRNLNQGDITQAVIASFAQTSNPRVLPIMSSLVRRLHLFARDVQLTEQDRFQGIDFLTRCGHTTEERGHEFILLSAVLDLSMLTVAMNHDKP